MNLQGLKIYYLENTFDDFEKIKAELIKEANVVYPQGGNTWKEDLRKAQQYLISAEEQREANGKQLAQVFLSIEFDLIIMDLYLKNDNPDALSTFIYDEVLKVNEKLNKVPVIFLTRSTQKNDLPLNGNVGYVLKPSSVTDENKADVIDGLFKEAAKFPDIIKAVSKAQGGKGKHFSFVTWLRANF